MCKDWNENEAKKMIDDTMELVDEKHGGLGFNVENFSDLDRRISHAWKRKDMAMLRVACAAFLEVTDEHVANERARGVRRRGRDEKTGGGCAVGCTVAAKSTEAKTGISSIFKATENGLERK